MNATDSTNTNGETALSRKTGSGFWVIGVVLTRPDGLGALTVTQTISLQNNGTEDEARGQATRAAMQEKPGFAIQLVTASWVWGELHTIPNIKLSEPAP